MTMTAEEIVREYRQAKYPEKQIRILADQNSCGPSNIKAILEQAGCELPRAGRRKKASPPNPKAPLRNSAWKPRNLKRGTNP